MRAVGKMMLVLGLVGAAGCTGDGGGVTNLDAGGCPTCVPDGGRFSIYVLDPTNFSNPDAGNPAQSSVVGFETIPLFQMTLSPSGNIGMAYVEFSADQTDNKPRPDPSLFNYDILYVEWSNGTIVVGPEKVTGGTPVQEFVGVTLDYFNGQPVVGYLGWVPAPGYDSTQAFWYQHAAVLSYRNLTGGGNPGTWTQVTVANNDSVANATGADEAAAGTACASDNSCLLGPITGLYPAVFADSTETILAYRNVHFGSSTGTGDFANSNLDIGYGSPSGWQYFGLVWGKPGIPLPNRSCALTTSRGGNGDHNKFVHGANGNPALIGDRGDGSNTYNSNGTDVIFFERQSASDTDWNCPLSLIKVGEDSNAMVTETGPYMAYDGNPSGQGYAVAVTDTKGGPGAALYKNCAPGMDCTVIGNWTVFKTVYETGSGGFFASVALNPDTHDPWVAYYFCSSNSSASVTSCPVSQRQLQVATSINGTGQWTPEPVDNKGAWQTQMVYLSNPTRLAIGYRDPASGALKLAVENSQ